MSFLEDVVIRRATRDDYESVLGIDDSIYDGMDYLPTCYHDFVEMDGSHLLLAEIHGKVVSVCIFNTGTFFLSNHFLLFHSFSHHFSLLIPVLLHFSYFSLSYSSVSNSPSPAPVKIWSY